MSFGEWHAHMDPFGGDFGRHSVLNIGREVAPGEMEIITALTNSGVTIERVSRKEGETTLGSGLHVPVFLGEVLYKALDRVYGKGNQTGKAEALEAVLAKEQARVDFILNSMLRPQVLPAHRVDE